VGHGLHIQVPPSLRFCRYLPLCVSHHFSEQMFAASAEAFSGVIGRPSSKSVFKNCALSHRANTVPTSAPTGPRLPPIRLRGVMVASSFIHIGRVALIGL